MKAVIDVATPVMVRTPLGTSSMYTPGYVGVTGIGNPPFLNQLLIFTMQKALSQRDLINVGLKTRFPDFSGKI
jgi:hypothetical protein